MGFLILFLVIYLCWLLYMYSDNISNWAYNRKELREGNNSAESVKKDRVKLSSSNHVFDAEYDKLISAILDESTVLGADEFYLKLSYLGDVYDIWIANKDCAYGTSLCRKNGTRVVSQRGLSKVTLEKLYKKEMKYKLEYGEAVTEKRKEDMFIKSMLESIEVKENES